MSNTTVYARSLSASFNLRHVIRSGVIYAYLAMFLIVVFCIFVKKKYPDLFTTAATVLDEEDNNEASLTEKIQKLSTDDPVSYTHLTLPTTAYV